MYTGDVTSEQLDYKDYNDKCQDMGLEPLSFDDWLNGGVWQNNKPAYGEHYSGDTEGLF